MACQFIVLFPFQPLHFGGGDVVQIGTSCFFFEVTWYILSSFHRLYHDRSCVSTTKTTPHRQFKNQRHLPRTKLGLQMMCFPCQNNVISGHPKRSGSIWLLLPSREFLRFLFLHNGSTIPEKKNPVPTGAPLGWDIDAFWCMYLPKGEYSSCRSGAHQVLQVCKQVCNKTHPGFI